MNVSPFVKIRQVLTILHQPMRRMSLILGHGVVWTFLSLIQYLR